MVRDLQNGTTTFFRSGRYSWCRCRLFRFGSGRSISVSRRFRHSTFACDIRRAIAAHRSAGYIWPWWEWRGLVTNVDFLFACRLKNQCCSCSLILKTTVTGDHRDIRMHLVFFSFFRSTFRSRIFSPSLSRATFTLCDRRRTSFDDSRARSFFTVQSTDFHRKPLPCLRRSTWTLLWKIQFARRVTSSIDEQRTSNRFSSRWRIERQFEESRRTNSSRNRTRRTESSSRKRSSSIGKRFGFLPSTIVRTNSSDAATSR